MLGLRNGRWSGFWVRAKRLLVGGRGSGAQNGFGCACAFISLPSFLPFLPLVESDLTNVFDHCSFQFLQSLLDVCNDLLTLPDPKSLKEGEMVGFGKRLRWDPVNGHPWFPSVVPVE